MKKISFLAMGCLVLASNMIITGQAHATIYKCVKPSGKVFYNDKPCAAKEAETTLKHEKTPKNPYIPKAVVVVTDSNKTAIKTSISTVSKTQDTTVGDNRNNSNGFSSSNRQINETNDDEMLSLLESEEEVAVSPERQQQRAQFAKREEQSRID